MLLRISLKASIVRLSDPNSSISTPALTFRPISQVMSLFWKRL